MTPSESSDGVGSTGAGGVANAEQARHNRRRHTKTVTYWIADEFDVVVLGERGAAAAAVPQTLGERLWSCIGQHDDMGAIYG